jgi:signal peptidase I
MGLAPSSAAALCICFECLTLQYRHFTISSESMAPTLPTGSCILTRLTGAGFRPEPGQIVVFRHPVRPDAFVARVIATGGQRVQMKAGRVWIDGVEVPQRPLEDDVVAFVAGPFGFPRCANAPVPVGGDCRRHRAQETLGNGIAYEVLDLDDNPLVDDTGEYSVPEGHLFLLGDNRDNSADSRMSQASGGMGIVPEENVIAVFERFLRRP